MMEIDQLYDQIWKLDEVIENLENFISKNNDNYNLEIFRSRKRKDNWIKRWIRMQARFNYSRRI